jgi:hypothetical protein
MKKLLAPIIVAAFLFGNLALCQSKMAEIMTETKEINEDYIQFYESILKREDLTDKRRVAYKNSLRTFMFNASDENFRNDPNLYEGLIEE